MPRVRDIDAGDVTRVVRELCIEICYTVPPEMLDDLPVWVVNDCTGKDFYAEAIRPWRRNDLLPVELRLPEPESAADGDGGG